MNEKLTQLPSLMRVNIVGLATIVRREFRRIVRIWLQTIVPPAITMTLYFVIFGSLIGRRIGEMDGVPYTTFIAPGLIMMSVISNSFGNVVSSFFSGKMQMHLEEMLVSPMSYATIVIGYVAGGVVRGLLVASLVTLVAAFFADLTVVYPLVTISVIVLTSVVFSLGGLLNALFAKTFDDEGAKAGWCLFRLGCNGPITYNSCATTKWNSGTSFPIEAGHPCLGCSEPNFWDKGGFYEPLSTVRFGSGAQLAGAAAAGVALGVAAAAAGRRNQNKFAKED